MARLRFPIEAGIAIRGEVKRRILYLAAVNNIEASVREDKGLLESLYIFTMTGEADKLRKVAEGVKQIAKDYEDE